MLSLRLWAAPSALPGFPERPLNHLVTSPSILWHADPALTWLSLTSWVPLCLPCTQIPGGFSVGVKATASRAPNRPSRMCTPTASVTNLWLSSHRAILQTQRMHLGRLPMPPLCLENSPPRDAPRVSRCADHRGATTASPTQDISAPLSLAPWH